MAKTTIELPPALHRKLRVKAAIENRSMNDIVVTAVKGYLNNFRIEPGLLESESRSDTHVDTQQQEESSHAGPNRTDR